MSTEQELAKMTKGDTKIFFTGAQGFGVLVGYDGNNVYKLYQCGDNCGEYSRREAAQFIESERNYQTKRVAKLS